MRFPILLIVVLTTPVLHVQTATAQEITVKVIPSRASVQKGSVFDLRVEITTRNGADDLTVAPLVPAGFRLDPMKSPGIEVSEGDSVVHIPHIGSDSSLTVWFRAWPPTFWNARHQDTGGQTGQKTEDYTPAWMGISTAEPKTFAFNILYTTGENGARVSRSQSVTTSVNYTTHLYLYLLSGLFGTVLGHLIKNGIDKRDKLSDTLQRNGLSTKVGGWLKELLGTNVTGLITILVIGFGTLLVLAKDGIPVAAWYQAVALGIGLALVTDDQLLARFATR